MLNKFILYVLLSFICGCSTTGKFLVLDNHGEEVKASFIQWNEDYAVTVKHIPTHPDYVYVSGKYDLQFFKHSANPVKWATLKNKEKIIFTGYSDNQYVEIDSVDLGTNIKKKNSNIFVYRAGIATIMPGMSGGAVLNSNREVVGMNLGFTSEKVYLDGEYSKMSVFVPYKVIQAEWSKYLILRDEK